MLLRSRNDSRKHGFPDAQKGVVRTVNLSGPTEGAAPQVPVAETGRYTFYNMNQTSGFILDQGALSLLTTDYDVFETFSRDFRQGLEFVHEAVELSYTDRIGFRYLDAVFPKADETFGEYLNPSVLGLTESFQGSLIHSFSETNLRFNSVTVMLRVILQDGQVGFPPDLLPNVLHVAERFRVRRGLHAILDIDGHFEGREAFNIDRIDDHLNTIHGEIAKVFHATITSKAVKVWE